MSASKSRYDGASFTLQLPTNGGENDAPLKTESRWIKNESSVFDSVCVEMSPLTTGAVYERLQEIMCPKLQKKKTSTNELVFRLEVISATLTWGGKFSRGHRRRDSVIESNGCRCHLLLALSYIMFFFFQSGVCIQTCAFLKKKKNHIWLVLFLILAPSVLQISFFSPHLDKCQGSNHNLFFPFLIVCEWEQGSRFTHHVGSVDIQHFIQQEFETLFSPALPCGDYTAAGSVEGHFDLINMSSEL